MKEQEKNPTRATRYPIPMPLRYRECGELEWQTGKVENISRTGILFAVQNGLKLSSRIEMAFDLPAKLAGAAPGHVYCEGLVVRTVLPEATDRPVSVAAQIERYKLLPGTQ